MKPDLIDICLCCATKDRVVLPYVLRGIGKIANLGQVFLVTPKPIEDGEIKLLSYACGFRIQNRTDAEALPGLDRSGWKYRPNWMFQMHCKLFQPFTRTEWFITVDCDTIILQPTPFHFFDGDKPVWWVGWPQHHKPYFEFNRLMLGFDKAAEHTFISDINLFNREIIDEMLSKTGCRDWVQFVDKSQKICNSECYMAEPELYGNYAVSAYQGLYEIRNLKQSVFGKQMQPESQVLWMPSEIKYLIDKATLSGSNTLGLHSWT